MIGALHLVADEGIDLRIADHALAGLYFAAAVAIKGALRGMLDALRTDTAFLEEDRALDGDLRLLIARIQARHWPLYEAEPS